MVRMGTCSKLKSLIAYPTLINACLAHVALHIVELGIATVHKWRDGWRRSTCWLQFIALEPAILLYGNGRPGRGSRRRPFFRNSRWSWGDTSWRAHRRWYDEIVQVHSLCLVVLHLLRRLAQLCYSARRIRFGWFGKQAITTDISSAVSM